jgi:hypothetical protein
MPLTGLSKEEIAKYETMLMQLVPAEAAIGNTNLLRQLSVNDQWWIKDRYFTIRNRLIEGGQLDLGKGKGGSVRRVRSAPITLLQSRPVVSENGAPQSERDLYEPMFNVIKTDWSLDNGLDPVLVEITAQGGRRPDGKWTRPDITVASYKTYPYVPGRHFDIITFEIKPYDNLDVTVVYEALAHRRAATRAYALLHVPAAHQTSLQEIVDEICLEAKRVGVGVIAAENPSNYQTWEELVDATRHEPEPQRLNDFLSKQVSQGFRERIITWFK